MKRILCALFLVITLFVSEVYSAEIDAESIMAETNNFYNKGYYEEAVNSIDRALGLYGDTDLPDNILLMAEAVYYAWVNSIYKNTTGNKRNREFQKTIVALSLHPEIISPRQYQIMNKMFDSEMEELIAVRKQAITTNNKSGWDRTNIKIANLQTQRDNFKQVVSGEISVDRVRKNLEDMKRQRVSEVFRVFFLIFEVLIVSLIVVLIFVIISNRKKRIAATDNFKTILEVVSMMDTTNSEEEAIHSSAMTLKSVDTKAEDFFVQENSHKDFMELQNKCVILGKRIDKATMRKNNSRKVSELVLKMCSEEGVSRNTALLYYCAAMVYDAGFLSVSRDILSADHLTIKQRYEIRAHVQNAAKYFDFIPDSIKKIFLDAAEFHHENFDGKGYLAGLRSTKIPLSARMIRVAESYVSLVSPRVYHSIMDSESAIKEMRLKKNVYDDKIIGLLEKVVL